MYEPTPSTKYQLPRELLRVFALREYAEQFSELGEVRMGEIRGYRDVNGHRKDADEAVALALVPGDVPTIFFDRDTGRKTFETTTPGYFNYNGASMNPAYILCCAQITADAEELRRRFGRWAVRVTDTAAFVNKLARSASSATPDDRQACYVDAFPVMYSKGLEVTMEEVRRLSSRLHYGQKSPEFSVEQEYRIAVVVSGPQTAAPSHLVLSTGSLRRISAIVDLGE